MIGFPLLAEAAEPVSQAAHHAQQMIEKLNGLTPEITLLIGAVVCMMLGLSKRESVRTMVGWIAGLFVATSAIMAYPTENDPLTFSTYVKLVVAVFGLLILLLAHPIPGQLRGTRSTEAAARAGRSLDPGLVVRGEFFAFYLFSLSGVMLCGSATDLVWMFLALELTSLPTYVMVAISRDRSEAQEAAVKYFFLGAFAAAVFLYGFALIYGGAGTTTLVSSDPDAVTVAAVVQNCLDMGRPLPPLLIAGGVLAILGIAFKIAAFPMHVYAADVYQGAATPVTAFLAIVPKTAGFLCLITLVSALAGPGELDSMLSGLIWVMAALTMTMGNVLALVQNNLKRLLAYSSIAHSGYMLLGLLAISGSNDHSTLGDGASAILFYLVAYGLGSSAFFAIITLLRGKGEEVETVDDLAGLGRRYPMLGGLLLLSVLSLIGLPPLVGFLGKIYLFSAAIEGGFVGLVVIAVLNSAISAVYYLRVASVSFFGEPHENLMPKPLPERRLVAIVGAIGSVWIGLTGGWLVNASAIAGDQIPGSSHEVPQAADTTAGDETAVIEGSNDSDAASQ